MGRPTLSPEVRALRRQEILVQVGALLRVRPYREISVQDIADYVGIAKGTFYFYFETKEEVFWELLIQNLEALIFEARMLMQHQADHWDTSLFVSCLRTLMQDYWHTVRYLPLLHTSLSATVELEKVRTFHQQLIQARDQFAIQLYQLGIPFADERQAQLYVNSLYGELVGIITVHEAFLLGEANPQEDPIFQQVMRLLETKILIDNMQS
ncbi:MAG: TetR/AcrR family transcriptional regulator [Phototrophicaceae bacterium]